MLPESPLENNPRVEFLPMADFVVWTMISLGIAGIIGLMIWLGMLTRNRDEGADIQKNLAIIASVTGVLVFLFGIAAYMYFSANSNYLLNYLMIMSFVNMFFSVFAVSASTLQITRA